MKSKNADSNANNDAKITRKIVISKPDVIVRYNPEIYETDRKRLEAVLKKHNMLFRDFLYQVLNQIE